jgi:hypothetical protein
MNNYNLDDGLLNSMSQLADLLRKITEANTGHDVEDRLYDAHCLAIKFAGHVFTALHLTDGTRLSFPTFETVYLDPASIHVITRAAMEAFLVFHYVFMPQNADEKEVRHLTYNLAELFERQDLVIINDDERQLLAREKNQIDDLIDKLKKNKLFLSFSAKHQKQLLEGNWRSISWHDLAINAGLSEMLAKWGYRFLSGDCHSSHLSVRQTTQAAINREEHRILNGTLATINILTANMINDFSILFPEPAKTIAGDSEGAKQIQLWIKVGNEIK